MSGPVLADTGGLLKALARTPDSKPSFPEYQVALATASTVIVPAPVLADESQPQLASVGRPGISKPLGRLTSADKARAMAGRERDRLVEEE